MRLRAVASSHEDTIMCVMGGEAELFNRILHQDLKRIVHRGDKLTIFVDHDFVLICDRCSDAVAHLVVILLPLLGLLLPENLCSTASISSSVVESVDPPRSGRDCSSLVRNLSYPGWRRKLGKRKGEGPSATNHYGSTPWGAQNVPCHHRASLT